MDLTDKTLLLTGGTGSFGRRFLQRALAETALKKIVVFSRDELKQSELQSQYGGEPRLRLFLGDVRDLQRLERAFHGVDIVVHAAALKQVPALEYNPMEAVKTNVIGAENIINAAIDQGVDRVIALSTDKAVNPANLYGATKLCAEKLFVGGNAYSGTINTRFSAVRYGNVIGSRGSVVPLFRAQRTSGRITITDERMTRFWITLDQAVDTVFFAIRTMQGGEIFVPKIPSMRVVDLASALAPECKVDVVGIRPGEKLHELLLTEDETRSGYDVGEYYVVAPKGPPAGIIAAGLAVTRLPDGFRYASDTNTSWLNVEELRRLTAGSTQA